MIEYSITDHIRAAGNGGLADLIDNEIVRETNRAEARINQSSYLLSHKVLPPGEFREKAKKREQMFFDYSKSKIRKRAIEHAAKKSAARRRKALQANARSAKHTIQK